MNEKPLSPRQQKKRTRILDAALKVFSQSGYSGASMDAIAETAEVSKPTLYMYFGSKEQLFESMMLARRDAMLEAFLDPSGNMVEDLHAFAWHYADAVMDRNMLSLARLIIGESQRFPEIGRAYQKAGPDRLLQGIIIYLEDQKQQGRLAFEEGELAAEDFWALILSAPRTKALHIPDDVPGKAAIRRYVENGLRVFLRAYSTHPDSDIRQLKKLTNKTRSGGNTRVKKGD